MNPSTLEAISERRERVHQLGRKLLAKERIRETGVRWVGHGAPGSAREHRAKLVKVEHREALDARRARAQIVGERPIEAREQRTKALVTRESLGVWKNCDDRRR